MDGVTIECYFSPSDGTTARILDAIDEADHSARAALFAFTNEDIGSALLDAHQRPGTIVQIDLEDAIYPGTEGWYVESNGVDVATHNTDDVQLQHKYAIIDEGATDDPLVITGNHNWSWYAETINDENTLIIHDATVANLFYQEWHARRNDVVGVAEAAARPFMPFITPSIASDAILVRSDLVGEMVIHDAVGRCVHRESTRTGIQRISVDGWPEGQYSVTLSSCAGQRIARFIVAH